MTGACAGPPGLGGSVVVVGVRFGRDSIPLRVDPARIAAVRVDHARIDHARIAAVRIDHARVDHARVNPARIAAVSFDHARIDHARIRSTRESAPSKNAPSRLTTPTTIRAHFTVAIHHLRDSPSPPLHRRARAARRLRPRGRCRRPADADQLLGPGGVRPHCTASLSSTVGIGGDGPVLQPYSVCQAVFRTRDDTEDHDPDSAPHNVRCPGDYRSCAGA